MAAAGLPGRRRINASDRPRFGDYQTNAALVLGKQRGENPRELAERIVGQLNVGELCEPPSDRWPRFHQLYAAARAPLRKKSRSSSVTKDSVSWRQNRRQRIVIDFGSPNVAKPMHVGHIRSTFLGDALARIAEFLGHDVIRDNHIGDWGTQFGMVIYGLEKSARSGVTEADPLAELVRIYKETNERGTKDQRCEKRCRRTGKIAGRRSGKFRDLETNVSIFRCRNFQAVTSYSTSITTLSRRKFL